MYENTENTENTENIENTENKRGEPGTAETGTLAEATSSRPVVAPAVDIYENDEGYLVFADLPGVASEGIDIRYEDGELRLQGARAEREADFLRVFRIPEDVDAQAIDAALDKGVLELRLPKAKTVQPRKIVVRAGA